jgi:type II secretory pathway pseudopilin PulG
MLIEMLVVIALLGFFGLLAAQLFSGTMTVVRTAPAAGDALARLDAVVERLRGDVWGAAALSVPDPCTLQISLADGQRITWKRPQPTDLARTVTGLEKDAPAQAWRGLRYRVSFVSAGAAAVVVHVVLMPDPARRGAPRADTVVAPAPDAQFVLVSQPLLSRRPEP